MRACRSNKLTTSCYPRHGIDDCVNPNNYPMEHFQDNTGQRGAKNSGVSTLIGRTVICINDDFSNAPPLVRIVFTFPRAGEKYTVRGVYLDSFLLKEIKNSVSKWPAKYNNVICEPAFYQWRFGLPDEVEHVEKEAEEISEPCTSLC